MERSYLVLYDLSSQKALRRAARACRDCGLRRLQRSVFAGDLQPAAYQLLCQKMQSLVDSAPDQILIIALSPKALGQAGSFSVPDAEIDLSVSEVPVTFL